ncbi:MAG: monovalent cation/H(+) antiporter subunit G [Rhodospirillaceae bacterium]|nr:monovalent cation/H(+) antiporter subunit G [Rhodospirillaceae bacterium]
MALAVDIASWLCLVAGALLCLAGGIGMIRFPDVYARSHAAGVIDTGGALFILFGLALQAGFSLVTVKLAIIGLLLFFTCPTATHALVKGALAGGLKPLCRELDADETAGMADEAQR